MEKTRDREIWEKYFEERLSHLERKFKSKKNRKRRHRRDNSMSSHSRSRSHFRSRSCSRSRSRTMFKDNNSNDRAMNIEPLMEDITNIDAPAIVNNTATQQPNITNIDVPIIMNNDHMATEEQNEVALTEDILKALGKRIAPEKILGPAIHKDIAERWIEVLEKGLPIDERSEILKKYPSPKNCILINAPKLNPELKAAATESALTRDARITSKQERIAGCITAIGKALSTALNGNGNAENLLIIEYLCDTGRLLSDLQREESLVRRSLILTGTNGPVKNILQNSSVDEWLCGKDLDEQLKTAKALER